MNHTAHAATVHDLQAPGHSISLSLFVLKMASNGSLNALVPEFSEKFLIVKLKLESEVATLRR